ncbi:ureidoglycolate lyase [Sphingomonas bacterium]|uniref:ureidoglycolate lyase n=1 Tax=Sphingomonas bacterium TaxID=1895847 RepID=UPI0026083850|nr:ureidoglycolate lyase [Sphingomonas bacterium]MDB5678595.1 allA [Sphingomonas bacterium]
MRDIAPQPLTAQSFAPFGDVIEVSDDAVKVAINRGNTDRYDRLAEIDVAEDGGIGVISMFRGRPLDPPVLKVFERHPLGSQAFMPLSGRPYLVAVAPDGVFDPSLVQVFHAEARQGVQYRKGVWHHFLLALDAESDFLVVDRAGPGNNCDEVHLAPRDEIRVCR